MKFVNTPNGIYDIEIMEKVFYKFLKEQRQGEVAITFIKERDDFSWLDKSNMNEQMKIWRKLAKEGKIKICKYNNREFEYKGVTYYTLVAQCYNGAEKQEQCGLCFMMICAFDTLVDGYGYCFRTQANRDSIYNYVMKDIDEPN